MAGRLAGQMKAPKPSGPRLQRAGVEEGLVDHLSDAGAQLLSRSEEVALATEYAEQKQRARSIALRSLVGARTFLQLTYDHHEDLAKYQNFWSPEASHRDLQQARHELLLLDDQRRALLALRSRRGRRPRHLEVALASLAGCCEAALERICVTDAFVDEVVREHKSIKRQVGALEPVTRRLEKASGLARDEVLLALLDPGANPAMDEPAETRSLRQRVLEERRAVNAYMQGQLELDADAVRAADLALQAAVHARDAAKSRFIEANLRLVIWVARRYAGRGMTLADLVQEGNLGLLAALDKFDPTRGYRFSTYATWWIRQSVQRGLANRHRTIRLPVHIQEMRRQLGKADRQLSQQLGREPSAEELARAHGSSLRRLERVRQAYRPVRSLSEPIQGIDGAQGPALSEMVEDSVQPSPEEALWANECGALVERLLDTLTPRERLIVRRRYGVNQTQERETLNTVATELGLTRERIRQIEISALKKLRKHARLMGIDNPLGSAPGQPHEND